VLKYGTKIHDNAKIGANCTIGGVGFGYELDEEKKYVLLPHLGNVVLKSFVEIGNNTCIDRAVMGSTILEENVKVDNLVHIAHGVVIGKNSLIIANSMIAGSTKIGENVWVAPSVSILNKKTISDNSYIGMGAVVIKDVKENETIVGNPGKALVKSENKP
jgi:UDP-3-O-[3-hydroxymyristoyl] glucosamine N-acyltransferase